MSALSSASKRLWFFRDERGVASGPYSVNSLRKLFQSGFLTGSSRFRKVNEGSKWRPIRKHPALVWQDQEMIQASRQEQAVSSAMAWDDGTRPGSNSSSRRNSISSSSRISLSEGEIKRPALVQATVSFTDASIICSPDKHEATVSLELESISDFNSELMNPPVSLEVKTEEKEDPWSRIKMPLVPANTPVKLPLMDDTSDDDIMDHSPVLMVPSDDDIGYLKYWKSMPPVPANTPVRLDDELDSVRSVTDQSADDGSNGATAIDRRRHFKFNSSLHSVHTVPAPSNNLEYLLSLVGYQSEDGMSGSEMSATDRPILGFDDSVRTVPAPSYNLESLLSLLRNQSDDYKSGSEMGATDRPILGFDDSVRTVPAPSYNLESLLSLLGNQSDDGKSGSEMGATDRPILGFDDSVRTVPAPSYNLEDLIAQIRTHSAGNDSLSSFATTMIYEHLKGNDSIHSVPAPSIDLESLLLQLSLHAAQLSGIGIDDSVGTNPFDLGRVCSGYDAGDESDSEAKGCLDDDDLDGMMCDPDWQKSYSQLDRANSSCSSSATVFDRIDFKMNDDCVPNEFCLAVSMDDYDDDVNPPIDRTRSMFSDSSAHSDHGSIEQTISCPLKCQF